MTTTRPFSRNAGVESESATDVTTKSSSGWNWWIIRVALIVAMTGTANAAEQIRLANNIAPAPFGYEPLTTRYAVSETTPIYVSPLIYPGAVSNNKLQPGQQVNALAKVKDYDWILIGQNGVGIGYIPISRLMPVNK